MRAHGRKKTASFLGGRQREEGARAKRDRPRRRSKSHPFRNHNLHLVKVVNLSSLGKYPTPRFSPSNGMGKYLRVKLRRDPMEKEFSGYQTKIGPAFAEAANEMYDGTRPPAGHSQWGCACRPHPQEDGCCCAAGCGLARCAQNPGGPEVPGDAGEKQPEGRGVSQALARSGTGTRSTYPRGATASSKGQIPGLCGRAGLTPVRERSDLPATASWNSVGRVSVEMERVLLFGSLLSATLTVPLARSGFSLLGASRLSSSDL